MFASGHQVAVAFAQPDLGFPADVLDHLGLFFESQLEMSTDLGGIAVRPGAFDQRLRAWVFPALVIDPCWRRSPEEYSEGTNPKNFMSSLGVSKRVRSPISATMVTATVNCTPRKAWRASTTGCKRHACTWSCSSCSRRWRRSVCSFTARTYS